MLAVRLKATFGRRLAILLAVIVTVASIAISVSADPAYAWSRGNVWVKFGSWNCPSGGNVTKIQWAVDSFSSGPAGGDIGDNVIYPTVRVGSGAYNTLSYKLYCTKYFGLITYPSVAKSKFISPPRSGVSYTF